MKRRGWRRSDGFSWTSRIERNRNHRHWRVQDVFRQTCCIHTIVAPAGLRNFLNIQRLQPSTAQRGTLLPSKWLPSSFEGLKWKGFDVRCIGSYYCLGHRLVWHPSTNCASLTSAKAALKQKLFGFFSLVHDYVTMNYEYDHFNRVSVFSICRSGRSNAPCGDQNCDGKRGNTFLPFRACKLTSDHKHTTPKIALVIQQETQSTWQSTV